MSDLISRSAVMELIESKFVDGCLAQGDENLIGGYELLDEVFDLPDAIDLENVVEQLMNVKTYRPDLADAMLDFIKRGKSVKYVCLDDVLEIIKSAANATNGKNGG